MKRALVTGGCGFIGSHLAKSLLEKGWVVDIVDNMSNGRLENLGSINARVILSSGLIKPLKEFWRKKHESGRAENCILVIQDDFSSPEMLEYIKADSYDIIFHQAALPSVEFSIQNPSLTTFENISKTVSLFEAAAGHVERIVFASSSAVYGNTTTFPTAESDIKNPLSPYAWQKLAIENYAKLACNLYDIDIVCLRYFNVFGPGQTGSSPYSTAIAAWCHATKEGIPLRSDGDGYQSRDMCYIDNIVHANILAATSDQSRYGGFKGNCYNIGTGKSISNKKIIDYFRANYDVAVRNAPERPGDVKHTRADIENAEYDFGYSPVVDFWEGLVKTINWWEI